MIPVAWMLSITLHLMPMERPPEYYLHKFYADKSLYTQTCSSFPTVDVVLGDLPGSIIGLCDPRGKVHVVTVSREFWKKATNLQKEELMYHELGHCVLGKPHKEGYVLDGGYLMPASIMKCCGLLGKDYAKYRDYYLWELFEGK